MSGRGATWVHRVKWIIVRELRSIRARRKTPASGPDCRCPLTGRANCPVHGTQARP
jgi:hypothetical protein